MVTRSAHERWRSRNEPLHHYRGCECTVASPAKTAARGSIKEKSVRDKIPDKRTKNARFTVPAEGARIQTITAVG